MNNASEQKLFKETVLDLKACQDQGKNIPIIVVINKVDDPDDDDVKVMINQCQSNIRRIMLEVGLESYPCVFCKISAMKSLNYRLFMASNSFNEMDKSAISQLAQLEFGREGLRLANSSNPADLETLRIRIQTSLTKNPIEWKEICGINNIITEIEKLLDPNQLPKVLIGKLSTHINELAKLFIPQKITDTKDRLLSILQVYKCYQHATKRLLYNKILMDMFDETKQKAILSIQSNWKNCKCWDKSVDTLDPILLLINLKLHDDNRTDDSGLLSVEEWSRMILDTIEKKICSIWNCYRPQTQNHSTLRLAGSVPASVTNGLPVTSSSSVSNHMEFKGLQSSSHYLQAVETTITILSNVFIKPYVKDIIYRIVIPILDALTSDMCKLVLNNQMRLLPFVETRVINIVKEYDDKILLKDLFYTIIKLKIKNKNSDYFAGYTSFRELLYKNPEIREEYFFDFYPVLYEAIPGVDIEWVAMIATEYKQSQMTENNHLHMSNGNMVTSSTIASSSSSAAAASNCNVNIDGYTDNIGRKDDSQTISSRRLLYEEKVKNHPSLITEKEFIRLCNELNQMDVSPLPLTQGNNGNDSVEERGNQRKRIGNQKKRRGGGEINENE